MVLRASRVPHSHWRRHDGYPRYELYHYIISAIKSDHLDFPRKPTYALKRHITDEADARLAFYLPLPEDLVPPPGVEIPPRPQLPEGTVDAPLIRLFNFLRTFTWLLLHLTVSYLVPEIMSLSYQLEILWYQVCIPVLHVVHLLESSAGRAHAISRMGKLYDCQYEPQSQENDRLLLDVSPGSRPSHALIESRIIAGHHLPQFQGVKGRR